MKRIVKEIAILGMAAVAVLYMFNPTAGFLEFIPDAFPIIGNLDEAGAIFIILAALRYYGLDLTRMIGSRGKGSAQGFETLTHRDDEGQVIYDQTGYHQAPYQQAASQQRPYDQRSQTSR